MQNLKLFVTGYKGFETLLFHELRSILGDGVVRLEKTYGGVEIVANLSSVYRICLHSHLTNRVFCELMQTRVENEADLYAQVYQIEWEQHLRARNSIAVSASLSNSKLTHDHYVALKVKDAIVDRFRDQCGSRPAIEKHHPDIQVHINIHRNLAKISLDLSGDSLHRRGYRLQHSGAPLKEHLAAALLLHAGWGRDQARALQLVDPMCGSGTFAIEAALIAAGIAPGLTRQYFGFNKWLLHDPQIWQDCIESARRQIDTDASLRIDASDYDANALAIAQENAQRAGVLKYINFSHQQVMDLDESYPDGESLVICNPPYGKRMHSDTGLGELYRDLGETVRRLHPARLAVISANPDLLHRLKLKKITRKDVKNGPLDCLFATFTTIVDQVDSQPSVRSAPRVDDLGVPLRNRLQKNSKHLRRWANKNGVSCYRVYDADLPEFAFALDRYQSEIAPDVEWFHLQEYQAPATVATNMAEIRIKIAAAVVTELFAIPEQHLFCKTRSRQRGLQQYQKQDNQNEFFQVREGAASLLINLSDYLDSGLFLDHRITRNMVYSAARDKSVLNLFCYTAAVGVQAGLGGARSVLNVDLSTTYLKWAQQNHQINDLDDESRYQFLRADILELLKNPGRFSLDEHYDLIFFDPPSFSNSSKMQQTLDIQRDHEVLIGQAMKLLAPQGLLLFSTNRRGFKLATSLLQGFAINDISQATIAEDFRRNPKIHRCWEFRHHEAG